MPVNIYEPCTNTITGETFQTLSFDASGLTMQWTVQPGGYVPFEHIHLHQSEEFVVETGEVLLTMDGQDHIASAGQSVTVPAGVAHIAHNNTDGVLDCKVTYARGFNHDLFMQCFMGLIHDGYLTKDGVIAPARMGYFTVKLKTPCVTRPTKIPAPLFRLSLLASYALGVLLGWNSLFEKYTGIK